MKMDFNTYSRIITGSFVGISIGSMLGGNSELANMVSIGSLIGAVVNYSIVTPVINLYLNRKKPVQFSEMSYTITRQTGNTADTQKGYKEKVEMFQNALRSFSEEQKKEQPMDIPEPSSPEGEPDLNQHAMQAAMVDFENLENFLPKETVDKMVKEARINGYRSAKFYPKKLEV